MDKVNEEQILKKISELEHEKMGYLEANDKAGARRKEKQIYELEDKLELLKLNEIKKELEKYKKFVDKRGLKNEFKNFTTV